MSPPLSLDGEGNDKTFSIEGEGGPQGRMRGAQGYLKGLAAIFSSSLTDW